MEVWKFLLTKHGRHRVVMPRGAAVLSVGEQENQVVVWALVDPGTLRVDHEFAVVMTGESIPGSFTAARFIGTVKTEGWFVVHVFDLGERS